MALIGDVLLGAREIFTDPADTVGTPSITSAIPFQSPSGALVPGTYYLRLSALNQWGETQAGTETPVTIAAPNNAFTISVVAKAGHNGNFRLYFSDVSGGQDRYDGIIVDPVTGLATITDFGNNIGVGYPPTRSTAYLPDSNGPALGVDALYRWLNDGMKLAAAANGGGIPDFSAVATQSGQQVYTLNSQWKKIDNAWYDGYPLYLGRKNDVFRRNKVTGTTGTLICQQSSNRLIIELWPQPSRSGGSGTLTAPITASDTSATASLSGFVLGFGLAMIGTEIVEFASTTGGLSGLTRGMGGTIATAWPSGTAVRELNLMISGYRVPAEIPVGSASSVFPLPAGWEDAMETYLVARFRKAEQDHQAAKALLDEFAAKMQQLRANKIISGPRQIQASGGLGNYNGLGTQFGGVIVP